MTEEKVRRLIVSATVGAIVLLFLLIMVMVYQLISINIEKKRERELEQKIAQYESLIESGEDIYEARSLRAWIEMRARELGYVYESDVPLS